MKDTNPDTDDWRSDVLSFHQYLKNCAESRKPDELLSWFPETLATALNLPAVFVLESHDTDFALISSHGSLFEDNKKSVLDQCKGLADKLINSGRGGIFQMESIAGFYKLFLLPVSSPAGQFLVGFIDQIQDNRIAISKLIQGQFALGYLNYGLERSKFPEWESIAQQTAALVEISQNCLISSEIEPDYHTLAIDLKRFTSCDSVLIFRMEQGNPKLLSHSELSTPGLKSSFLQSLENVILDWQTDDENLVSIEAEDTDNQINWPEDPPSGSVSVLRLKDRDVITRFHICFYSINKTDQTAFKRKIEASEDLLRSLLIHLTRIKPTFIDKLSKASGSRKSWYAMATGLIVLISLFLPIPDSVRVDFILEPETSRNVAMPFPGRMEKILVEPGDNVSKGQALIELDPSDINSRLAEVSSQLEVSKKYEQAALASKSPSEYKVYQLERLKLEIELEYLLKRQGELIIQAPIEGTALFNDLKPFIGIPRKDGDPLLTVASMDSFYAVLAVPEKTIHKIFTGANVTLKPSFKSDMELNSIVKEIGMATTQFNNMNVVPVKVRVEAPHLQLRPGMGGIAKIRMRNAPIVVILFEDTIEALRMKLFW